MLNAEDEPPVDERAGSLPFLTRLFGVYRQVPSTAETAAEVVQACDLADRYNFVSRIQFRYESVTLP